MTSPTPSSWTSGNAAADAATTRGWLVGHFLPPGSPLHSDDVEIKWGHHQAGEQRSGWADGDDRSTLTVLVHGGPFRVQLADADVLLSRPGDYVLWHPGTGHKWDALELSTLLTVRWPSSSQIT
ncbi:signal peptidase I [Amycolatopsis sp. NBC_01286]|uniref:signal peptidase I n=1 Tax=Amycolatopsis sp. NBC_01286 TaxID=2903560 RepID=UPI002E117BE3|nr:signal peptidase I [Amycolatopsis sp. NBC_01286]